MIISLVINSKKQKNSIFHRIKIKFFFWKSKFERKFLNICLPNAKKLIKNIFYSISNFVF
ncbi:MAG: hypothetical protein EAZ97_13450 [Bacteroidetes bacterium]|nr:MAG: hypothetical protein EAZ97_13450 [Bacteroidota bacterium]